MGPVRDSADLLGLVVLGARGFAAIAVLTTLVGGIPRVAQAALAVGCGTWSSLAVANKLLPVDGSWQVALVELAIGAALGVVAAVPLLAARAAGRITELAATGRGGGPYEALFGLLAGVVFVGMDGHIATLTAIVNSHQAVPFLAVTRGDVLAAIVRLIPAAIRLAIPWLITAAVVQISIGVGTRLAGRASAHVPSLSAAPAALVMMTATLVGTFAIAVAAVVRGTL